MADSVAIDIRDPAAWDRLVNADPVRALEVSGGLDHHETDVRTRVLALHARARSQFELGRLDEAADTIARAVELWEDVSEFDDDATGLALAATTAVVLAESGRLDEALDLLEQLASRHHGAGLGRLHGQRAYVLQHAGRLHEALGELDTAERLIRANGSDDRDVLRILMNRGLVLLQQGRLDAAEADFDAASRMARTLGMLVAEAQCAANLGVLFGRARRLRDALAAFDRARSLFDRVGRPNRAAAGMELDRAEVQLYSGLVLDAVDTASTAWRSIVETGNRVQAGDAALLLSRAHLAARQLGPASDTAARAAAIFDDTGRPHMTLHARAVLALTDFARSNGEALVGALVRTRELVDDLHAVGWDREAVELSVARITVGYRAGQLEHVTRDLAELRALCARERRDLALAGWLADAVARRNEEPIIALDSCRRGLDFVDDIVAEAATLEERSAAMRIGQELGRLAIDIAVDLGDPDTVLAAAEGTRARSLHEELSEERSHRPLTASQASRLVHELTTRLGDRTLVEWIVSIDDVWAVVLSSDERRLVRVASVREVVRARDRVLVWLDLAVSEPDAGSGRAVRAAALLDDLLLGPLELADLSGVVLVPVDVLHGIPWSGLPTFAARPVTLAPSAGLWLAADRRAAGAASTVGVVAGPDLDAAALEIESVGRWFPHAAVAAGAGATASSVRSMFAGHDVIHVAAHGRFRSDRPLLSTLRLHDGESTLFDVVPERCGARLVVLSSCEGGAHGTADGAEVLGLSSVMLARGAATVVAPLTVVRDLECAEFVAEVHAELARGEPVACAVANVRGRWLDDDDLSRWAVASSFSCFGSGATITG